MRAAFVAVGVAAVAIAGFGYLAIWGPDRDDQTIGGPAPTPTPQDPDCTERDAADFSVVIRERITILLLNEPIYGDITCTHGHWHTEHLNSSLGIDAESVLRSFRDAFGTLGWDETLGEGFSATFKGPCSPTLACEATVVVEPTGDRGLASLVDVTLDGQRTAPEPTTSTTLSDE